MNEIDLALKKNKNQMLMRVVALILIVLALISWVFSPEKNTPTEKDEILENEKVSFNVSLDTLENAYKDFPSRKEVNVIDNNPFSSDKTDSDDMILEILDEMEKDEATSQANPYTNDEIRKVSKLDNSKGLQLEKKLSYEEELAIARAEKFGSPSSNKKRKYIPSVTTKVVFYGNQHVLPTDYARLMLTENVTFQGKTFSKGTFLYADIRIDDKRVYFDITNINHVPLNLEFRDLQDGKIGLRSKRAGELWLEYQRESSARARDDIADEVETETKSRFLGNSMRALSSFFKKKKIKDSKKIWLINDQKLILKITPAKK